VRSGFVSVVGRPNVGKSSLVNRICGTKVAIVSDKPQTTRSAIRGILHRPEGGEVEATQIVFVDTPGIHKPRSAIGPRLNKTATDAMRDVDATLVVIDALAPLGPGDRFVAEQAPKDSILVVNKTDWAQPQQVLAQLTKASELDFAEYFPVSAKTGEGVDALLDHLIGLMPEGPPFYPDDMITDVPEVFWVAELVREQLLWATREELPHSIACQVVEWEWPRIRVEILVERESQKGIVIGHKGETLKMVGTRVRRQLPEGAFLELHVKVDKTWTERSDLLDNLGY
jgi:GTP-binding protein Era